MLVGVPALLLALALVGGLLLERLGRLLCLLRCLRLGLGGRRQDPVVATATVRGLVLGRRRLVVLRRREGRGLLRLER